MLAPESARNYLTGQDYDRMSGTENRPLLVDVRTPEAYEDRHIRGAVNACVYEIQFLKTMEGLAPERERTIVLYGQGEGFFAPEAALQKLLEAGYGKVSILRGGINGWDGAVEGKGRNRSANRAMAGTYQLDPETSILRWIGRNLSNQHDGTIALKSGELRLDDSGKPAGGAVEVDMTRMTCKDLEDPSMAKLLIGHLSNQDFFLVERYPTASIRLTRFEPIREASAGRPNYHCAGEITVRGVTQPIELEALVAPGKDGQVVFQSAFDLDRTRHGAIYGSGRFFERLGMHLVNDLVHIQVQLFFAPVNPE